jgi:hypothetical protein
VEELLCWFVADSTSPSAGLKDILVVTVDRFGYEFANLICIWRNCTGVSGVQQEDGACSVYSNFLTSETPSCLPQQTMCLMGMVSGAEVAIAGSELCFWFVGKVEFEVLGGSGRCGFESWYFVMCREECRI